MKERMTLPFQNHPYKAYSLILVALSVVVLLDLGDLPDSQPVVLAIK